MMRHAPTDSTRDRGFTLIEMIVVSLLIALVGAAIAATASVILRTTPEAQFQVDDARSRRGLQTWLTQDVASTPPNDPIVVGEGGFDDTATDPCAAGTGSNILAMEWTEDNRSTVTTYRANYRLVGDDVVRYICSTSSPTASISLTSGVRSTPCDLHPTFADVTIVDPDAIPGNGDEHAEVEFCFVSVEADVGFNPGGDDEREITLDISSRNPTG